MREAQFQGWFRRHTVYVEREVGIIGVAIAAFLVVNPRRKADQSPR